MVLDISVFLLSVSVLVLVTAATLRRDLTPIPRRAQQRKYLHQQDAVQDVTQPSADVYPRFLTRAVS